MQKDAKDRMYAFPAVQAREELDLAIRSLAPLLRHLRGSRRSKFERLLQQLQRRFHLHRFVRHLSPYEFILLGLIIEMLEASDEEVTEDHPPFP